mmetsp:Transcript_140380/g.364947  ORF Transcript_140380/g.364947 Transcript_140380/m.364947 type:complete len:271 (-) Transcript_140380:80-892(-)
MELQVVLDVARDEEVGVVEALAHAEVASDAPLLAGRLQRPWLQLRLQEIVRRALIHEQTHGRATVLFHQFNSVVLVPCRCVAPQIQRKGLLTPRCISGVCDRSEGGHRAVLAWILESECQRAVAAHAVAHDRDLVCDDGHMLYHDVVELLGHVVVHVVMLFVLLRGCVQIEAGTLAEVIGVGILVGHGVASRGGVRHHQHKLQRGRRLESPSLLREVLIGTCKATQPKHRRELCALLAVRRVDCEDHLTITERRASVLIAPKGTLKAPDN